MSPLFNSTIGKKVAVFFVLFTIAFATRAQEAAAPSGDNINWLEILLVITAIVLLLVIWGMGQIMLVLGKRLNAKRKDLAKTTSIMILLGLISLGTQAQTAGTAPATIANYGGISPGEFWALASVIAIEFVVIVFLGYMGRSVYRELTGIADLEIAKLDSGEAKSGSLAKLWRQLDEKIFTRAVPVEQEEDVLLDHDYDGIKELDNALPPWWKYGFYITIVAAVIYVFNFHVFGTGKNPEQEYAAEMEEGKRIEEAYKAKTKNLVDENNITIADAAGIAEGQKIFKQSCIACHGQNGEGGIGPNLTDVYWMHGGSMNDIYKTIKIGYPDKGMQSWEAMFSPVQIKDLASFVKSLKGTNPANAKASQGDEFKE
jgi:cytochrome c oxidase cbb3-type subunit III